MENKQYSQITVKLRQRIEEIFTQKVVDYFLVYESGSFWFKLRPLLLKKVDEAERVVYNRLCQLNLSTFLKTSFRKNSKIGLIVKKCDLLSVVEQLKNNQVARENLYIIQVACDGILDWKKIEKNLASESWNILNSEESGKDIIFDLSDRSISIAKTKLVMNKCFECDMLQSKYADEFITIEDEELKPLTESFVDTILEFEKLSLPERHAYWNNYFSICIRCYSCRNVCPACFCSNCLFDQQDVIWINPEAKYSENYTYHLTRVLHTAGECVECGECERVCPLNIPLKELNSKLSSELKNYYGYQSGKSLDEISPFKTYSLEDLDEFK